jgi:prepilin-type N-terminal cleavage/methylation domain-containing protein
LRRSSIKGFSLLETLVSVALLASLVVVTFALFRDGLYAWKRATAHSSMLQDLNASTAQLTRWLERSNASSLSTAPAVLSGLDCAQDDASVLYDHRGNVLWQCYRVAFLDGEGKLRWREVPLTATAPQRSEPGPIDSYDDGTGLKALASYCTGGRILAEHLTSCVFTLEGNRVRLQLLAERPRLHSAKSERVRLETSVLARN